MNTLSFSTTMHCPNLLQLARSLPSVSEQPVLKGAICDPAERQALGMAAGDGADSLGPSVGDDTPTSDVRLKEIIARVGTTVYGLPLYRFRYTGRNETYEGVMAQDVLKVMPSAVHPGEDGFYRVDLGQLGVEMRRVS